MVSAACMCGAVWPARWFWLATLRCPQQTTQGRCSADRRAQHTDQCGQCRLPVPARYTAQAPDSSDGQVSQAMQQCTVVRAQKSRVSCTAYTAVHTSRQRQTLKGAILRAIMACSTSCAALHGQSTVLQGKCVQGAGLCVKSLLVACCSAYCPFTTPHGHSTDWLDIDIG